MFPSWVCLRVVRADKHRRYTQRFELRPPVYTPHVPHGRDTLEEFMNILNASSKGFREIVSFRQRRPAIRSRVLRS